MQTQKCRVVEEKIVGFIKDYVGDRAGVVLGLSGGLDSTLVAHLAVKALGREKVFGMMLPNGSVQYNAQNNQDAMWLAKKLGIKHRPIDISLIVNTYRNFAGYLQPLTLANIAARVRMTLLYAAANEFNRMVIGTTNKTEWEVGYFTKWGDGAVDFEPIADLYKTETRDLARYMGVDKRFLLKKPTADLWLGQTDEGEMGLSYANLDKLLKATDDMDHVIPPVMQDLNERGITIDMFKRARHLKNISEHKRRPIPHPSLREYI